MRISDWCSDVCSSVLVAVSSRKTRCRASQPGCSRIHRVRAWRTSARDCSLACRVFFKAQPPFVELVPQCWHFDLNAFLGKALAQLHERQVRRRFNPLTILCFRSEEHTSELQSLMRTSYAVFCLKKKKDTSPTINLYNNYHN